MATIILCDGCKGSLPTVDVCTLEIQVKSTFFTRHYQLDTCKECTEKFLRELQKVKVALFNDV